jgi:hypothetical protein
MEQIVDSIAFPKSVHAREGYYLLVPDQAGPPTAGDENGGATLTVTTNLPDGTIVLVGYDAGNAGGSRCCPAVSGGQLTIAIGNQHCLDASVAQSDGFRFTLGVAPAITGDVYHRITGSYPECPGTCKARIQPTSVLHSLGAHFERLTGDQVANLGADNELIATSQRYAWPADTCGLVASRSP